MLTKHNIRYIGYYENDYLFAKFMSQIATMEQYRYQPPSREAFETAVKAYKGIITINSRGWLRYRYTKELLGIPIYDFKQPNLTLDDLKDIKVDLANSSTEISKCVSSKVAVELSPTTILVLGSYRAGKQFYPDMPQVLPIGTIYQPYHFNYERKDGQYCMSYGNNKTIMYFVNGAIQGQQLHYTRDNLVSIDSYLNGLLLETKLLSTMDNREIKSVKYTGRHNMVSTYMPGVGNTKILTLNAEGNGNASLKSRKNTIYYIISNNCINGPFAAQIAAAGIIGIADGTVINVTGYIRSKIKGNVPMFQSKIIDLIFERKHTVGKYNIDCKSGPIGRQQQDWNHKSHGIQEQYFYQLADEVDSGLGASETINGVRKITRYYWVDIEMSSDDYHKQLSGRKSLMTNNMPDVLTDIVMQYLV